MSEMKRVGFIFSEILDRNIEIYCAATGTQKSELARKLLEDFLRSQGFDNPSKELCQSLPELIRHG